MAFDVACFLCLSMGFSRWVSAFGFCCCAFGGRLRFLSAAKICQEFLRAARARMLLGEVYGKLDRSWKTLGGNGAGFGKRICNCAQLGGLLCRRVFVLAQEMLRCAKVGTKLQHYNITKSFKSCHSSVSFLLAGEDGSLHFSR